MNMTTDPRMLAAAKRVAASLPPLTAEKAASIRALLLDEHIQKVAAVAPALTEDQRNRLRNLLQSRPEIERACVPVPPLPTIPPRVGPSRGERQPRKPEPLLSGVYFIRSGELVKIGTSTNVHARIAALRNMSSLPLELLAVAAGSYDEETAVHERFRHLRQHGEWFTATPELLAFIAEVTA